MPATFTVAPGAPVTTFEYWMPSGAYWKFSPSSATNQGPSYVTDNAQDAAHMLANPWLNGTGTTTPYTPPLKPHRMQLGTDGVTIQAVDPDTGGVATVPVASGAGRTQLEVPYATGAGQFAYADPAFVSVKQFGAVGNGATDDTAAVQAAVDFVRNNPGRFKTVFFPSGNYVVDHIEDLAHVSLNGAAPSRAVAGLAGLSLTTNIGSRIIQKAGATQPLIKPTAGLQAFGWQKISNLTLQGQQQTGVTVAKVSIASAATRHTFTVATGSLPAAPSNVASFPYYGVCAFYDANGYRLGTGIVQSVNTGTGQVTLLPGTDNYTAKTGASNLLTATEKVAFAPRSTYTADGFTYTDVSDSTMLSPPAIYTEARTTIIENVYIRDFWCGIVIGDSVCRINGVWTNNCGMAGLALRTLGAGADVSGTKWYFQGGHWQQLGLADPAVAKQDSAGAMSLCGVWGVASNSYTDELVTNNCYHGVIDCGGGSNTGFGYVYLDLPLKEAWWTVNGIGGVWDPTITIDKFTARSNGQGTVMPVPASTSFPTGQRSAIAIQGATNRVLSIGTFAAERDPTSLAADDYAYGTYIGTTASTGRHDVHIRHLGGRSAIATALSGGVYSYKAGAPFGSVGTIANQMLAKRALFGADDSGTLGVTDNANKSARLGMHNYDIDAAYYAFIAASTSSTSNFLGVGGGDGAAEVASSLALITAAKGTLDGLQRVVILADGRIAMRRGATSAASPDASAILDIQGVEGGALMPRLTTTERDAIASPANGLVVFNTTRGCLQERRQGTWVDVADDKTNLQAGMWATPNSLFVPSTIVATASTLRVARFVPRRRLTVVKIGFVTTNAATANDAVDVGIYDSAGNLLVASGATLGKANATLGAQKVDIASTDLLPGRAYYAGLAYGAVGATAATLGTVTCGASGPSLMFGTTVGLFEAGNATAGTLPSTLAAAAGSSTAFNLALLES